MTKRIKLFIYNIIIYLKNEYNHWLQHLVHLLSLPINLGITRCWLDDHPILLTCKNILITFAVKNFATLKSAYSALKFS